MAETNIVGVIKMSEEMGYSFFLYPRYVHNWHSTLWIFFPRTANALFIENSFLFQRGLVVCFVDNPNSGKLHEWRNEQRTGRWLSIERSK